MQGVNGLAALSKLTGFTGWAEQQGVLAAAMGAKATANVTAYTVASLAMPSLPEIAAVNAARVAAHGHGGDLDGSAELAEAAKTAIDTRAALVMETYEAATSAIVSTPNSFPLPPTIAAAPASQPNQNSGKAGQNPATAADPVQVAVATAQAVLSNPNVVGGVTQAAQVATSVAGTGVSTVGHVAGGAVAMATNALATPAQAFSAPVPAAVGGIGTAAVLTGGTALATRTVSFGGTSAGIGNSGETLRLPEGWGAPNPGGPGGTTVAELPEGQAVAAPPGAPAPTRSSGAGGGNPLLGRQTEDEEEESLHKGHDYLHGDHFGDGRVIAAGVIGGDPNAEPGK
jgi:hypothetical protein